VNHPQAIQEILTNDRNKFAALGELKQNCATRNQGLFSLHAGWRSPQTAATTCDATFHGERMRVYGQLISNLTEKSL
jgi:unspecific monooxygenase